MDCFLGQIELLPYTFAPRGWMPCAGQSIAIGQYQALFSLLGTNFGGDGRTTFNLPDLQGKAPAQGLQYYIAVLTGSFPTRD